MKKLEVRLVHEPGRERVVGQLAESGRQVYFEYDPAWVADTRGAVVEDAQGLLAVDLEAAVNGEVTLTYRDPRFTWGLVVGAFALPGWFVLAGLGSRAFSKRDALGSRARRSLFDSSGASPPSGAPHRGRTGGATRAGDST